VVSGRHHTGHCNGEKSFSCPLNRRLGGPHIRSGRFGEQTKPLLLLVLRPQTVLPVANRFTDWAMVRSVASCNLLATSYISRTERCKRKYGWTGVYLLSNTTIWWRNIYMYIYIYIIYYIENNYMFRRLIMAIFRLYMKHLISSYTKHIYMSYLYGVGRG